MERESMLESLVDPKSVWSLANGRIPKLGSVLTKVQQ